MLIARTVAELRHHLSAFKQPVFVPTMGNLHEGHLNLLRLAKPLGDVTVASIFVNRLQFLPHEDFASYPRTFDSDCQQLQAHACDVLFAPDETQLYPQPQTFKVQPDPALANILEGEFRPGFFTGVSRGFHGVSWVCPQRRRGRLFLRGVRSPYLPSTLGGLRPRPGPACDEEALGFDSDGSITRAVAFR